MGLLSFGHRVRTLWNVIKIIYVNDGVSSLIKVFCWLHIAYEMMSEELLGVVAQSHQEIVLTCLSGLLSFHPSSLLRPALRMESTHNSPALPHSTVPPSTSLLKVFLVPEQPSLTETYQNPPPLLLTSTSLWGVHASLFSRYSQQFLGVLHLTWAYMSRFQVTLLMALSPSWWCHRLYTILSSGEAHIQLLSILHSYLETSHSVARSTPTTIVSSMNRNTENDAWHPPLTPAMSDTWSTPSHALEDGTASVSKRWQRPTPALIKTRVPYRGWFPPIHTDGS